MSQLASFNACQIPLKLGFPSGVRGMVLDGVWAKAAVTRSKATITLVVRILISPPSFRPLRYRERVRRSGRSRPRDFPRDRHIRRSCKWDLGRAEWLLSTTAYSFPDRQW